MWLWIWLKYLCIVLGSLLVITGLGWVMVELTSWIERRITTKVPGMVIVLCVVYTLYFSILLTWIEIGKEKK